MKWLTNLFRRGDYEAASSAIDTAIRTNASPSIAEIAELSGISESVVQELIETAATGLIQQRVADGVYAGSVPSQPIYDQAIGLGLPADRAKMILGEAVSNRFTQLVLDVLEDGQIDPSEDKRLSDFMVMIGQSALSPDTQFLIEQGRNLYRAYHGALEKVEAPILLKRGEFCVHVVAAEGAGRTFADGTRELSRTHSAYSYHERRIVQARLDSGDETNGGVPALVWIRRALHD